MSDIYSSAKRHVLSHYGNLLSVEHPIYNEYRERYIVNVKSN